MHNPEFQDAEELAAAAKELTVKLLNFITGYGETEDMNAESAFIPGPMPTDEIVYADPQNELQETLRNSAPSWVKPEKVPRTSKKRPPMLVGTRRLTIKEQARLKTFPDWVKFEGRVTSQARQIGNAVPPVFSSQIFAEIFKTL